LLPKPLRKLLLRYRRKLTQAQKAERNRLQNLLEIANIKLGSVATDVIGVSGRAILRALIDDTASPAEMADLALGRLWRRRDELTHVLHRAAGRRPAVPAVDAVAPGGRHRDPDRRTRSPHCRKAGAIPG
jgi:hypothetical protein